MCGLEQGYCEKSCEIQGGGQEWLWWYANSKNFNNDNSAESVLPLHVSLWFGTKFTWIVVIKIYAISLPSQPFLAVTLDFTSFFTITFLGAAPFFYSWGGFWIRFTSFCNYIHILQCCIFPLLVVVTCLFVFFTVADICSTLHVYHAYFFLNLHIYCTCQWLIKSKHEAAKYM